MSKKPEQKHFCVICEAPAVKVYTVTGEESEILRPVLPRNGSFTYGLCQQHDDPEHAKRAEAAILQSLTATRFKKEDFANMDPTSFLDHAILYARLGWHVFPLHNPRPDGACSCGKADCNRVGKHPRLKEWQDKATTDEDTIRKWWAEYPSANIGIVTGEKSGIVVLDIDGATGWDSFKVLARLCDEGIPDNVVARTGKGLHFFFAHAGEEMRNRQGILPNIDLRGDGGYVVAPPSLHGSGKRYRWEQDRHPRDRELEKMPECITDFINMPVKGQRIGEGERNTHLFRVGAALRGKGMEQDEILQALLKTNARLCNPPLSEAEVKKIAASASKYDPNTEAEEKKGTSIGVAQLIALAAEEFVFFHTHDQVGYAAVTINDRKQVMALKSQDFREYLNKRSYEKFQRPAKAQPLLDTISILNAQAKWDFEEKEVHSRVAMQGDAIYIDLRNSEREVVQISPVGWDIISNSPVHFLTSKAGKPLPRPEKGGNISDLRKFINVPDDDQWILMVAWLVKAFIPRGAFPVLVIQGEQGSAKTTASKIMKKLVDPTKAPLRSLPLNKQDFYVAAVPSWALAFDNLSGVPPWASDILCCLSTGGGFSVRALYTADEETIYEAQRPILINGIEDLATRNDLADRSLLMYLPSIPSSKRREEAVVLAEFEKAKARVLGALFDAVSQALRNFPNVKLDTLPRMADFARWIVAAEPALPWEKGKFMEAYDRNRRDALSISFEVDIVASIIRDFVKAEKKWEGTASELLDALKKFDPEETVYNRAFPKAANLLTNRLRRVLPSLRLEKLDADEIRRQGKKIWRFQLKK